MTKKELEAALAALQAQVAAKSQTSAQPIASLATSAAVIPDAVVNAFVEATANVADDTGRAMTVMQSVQTFYAGLPIELHGKPLSDEQAKAMGLAAAKILYATHERKHAKPDGTPTPIADLPKDVKDAVMKSVTQCKSRLEKLYRCAPVLPACYARGFSGGFSDTLKLCTTLQDRKYDVDATFAARAAAAVVPKDHKGDTERAIAKILADVAEGVPFLTATAKAQLVYWCDLHGLNPKGANDHRNLQLAKG